MRKPKFKIGDVLKPILEDTDQVKLHVVEVIIQSCEAGTQIIYQCRVYTKSYKSAPFCITKSLFGFNEMEVELWKDKKGETK